MSQRVIISADSTCDLGEELKNEYQIEYFPYHIILDGKQYTDGVDIFPDDLYSVWHKKHLLPKTAAISAGEYFTYFKKWVDAGFQVVHLNLGSALSSSYQNCCIAAKELGNVFPINSCNLSTGLGLLVLEAAERARAGMPAEQIQQEISWLIPDSHASFILDTLEFMHAGGRCSAVTALGANLLRLKPCIQVDNHRNGAMGVGKKYRGDLEQVLNRYVEDLFSRGSSLKLDRAFITHSGISENKIQQVTKAVQKAAGFKKLYITRASCTISAHCGPNTLGVLFMTRSS